MLTTDAWKCYLAVILSACALFAGSGVRATSSNAASGAFSSASASASAYSGAGASAGASALSSASAFSGAFAANFPGSAQDRHKGIRSYDNANFPYDNAANSGVKSHGAGYNHGTNHGSQDYNKDGDDCSKCKWENDDYWERAEPEEEGDENDGDECDDGDDGQYKPDKTHHNDGLWKGNGSGGRGHGHGHHPFGVTKTGPTGVYGVEGVKGGIPSGPAGSTNFPTNAESGVYGSTPKPGPNWNQSPFGSASKPGYGTVTADTYPTSVKPSWNAGSTPGTYGSTPKPWSSGHDNTFTSGTTPAWHVGAGNTPTVGFPTTPKPGSSWNANPSDASNDRFPSQKPDAPWNTGHDGTPGNFEKTPKPGQSWNTGSDDKPGSNWNGNPGTTHSIPGGTSDCRTDSSCSQVPGSGQQGHPANTPYGSRPYNGAHPTVGSNPHGPENTPDYNQFGNRPQSTWPSSGTNIFGTTKGPHGIGTPGTVFRAHGNTPSPGQLPGSPTGSSIYGNPQSGITKPSYVRGTTPTTSWTNAGTGLGSGTWPGSGTTHSHTGFPVFSAIGTTKFPFDQRSTSGSFGKPYNGREPKPNFNIASSSATASANAGAISTSFSTHGQHSVTGTSIFTTSSHPGSPSYTGVKGHGSTTPTYGIGPHDTQPDAGSGTWPNQQLEHGTWPGEKPGSGSGTTPSGRPGTGTWPGRQPVSGSGTWPNQQPEHGTWPGEKPGSGSGTTPSGRPGTGTWPGRQPVSGSGTWPNQQPEHGTWPGEKPGSGSGTTPSGRPGTGTWPGGQPVSGSGTWPNQQSEHGTWPGEKPGSGSGTTSSGRPGTGTWPGGQPESGSGTWPNQQPEHGTWPGEKPGSGSGTIPSGRPGTGTWPRGQPGSGSGTWPNQQSEHGTWPGEKPGSGSGSIPSGRPGTGTWPGRQPGSESGTWPNQQSEHGNNCLSGNCGDSNGPHGGSGNCGENYNCGGGCSGKNNNAPTIQKPCNGSPSGIIKYYPSADGSVPNLRDPNLYPNIYNKPYPGLNTRCGSGATSCNQDGNANVTPASPMKWNTANPFIYGAGGGTPSDVSRPWGETTSKPIGKGNPFFDSNWNSPKPGYNDVNTNTDRNVIPLDEKTTKSFNMGNPFLNDNKERGDIEVNPNEGKKPAGNNPFIGPYASGDSPHPQRPIGSPESGIPGSNTYGNVNNGIPHFGGNVPQGGNNDESYPTGANPQGHPLQCKLGLFGCGTPGSGSYAPTKGSTHPGGISVGLGGNVGAASGSPGGVNSGSGGTGNPGAGIGFVSGSYGSNLGAAVGHPGSTGSNFAGAFSGANAGAYAGSFSSAQASSSSFASAKSLSSLSNTGGSGNNFGQTNDGGWTSGGPQSGSSSWASSSASAFASSSAGNWSGNRPVGVKG